MTLTHSVAPAISGDNLDHYKQRGAAAQYTSLLPGTKGENRFGDEPNGSGCAGKWKANTGTATDYEECESEHWCAEPGFRVNGAAPLAHAGEDCWVGCNNNQGPCDWCGSGNLCCRYGWDDHSNGCDGTLGIQGSGHVCIAPP